MNNPIHNPTPTTEFQKELEKLINYHSLENGSDTPDFILAAYLRRCLDNFNETMFDRSQWYGNPVKETIHQQAPLEAETLPEQT